MEQKTCNPIAAFDVGPGSVTALGSTWPSLETTADYRWLHLDLNDAQTGVWAHEHLPEVAAMALLQEETRPRCERHGDGLILNLRAVNLNPESDPEDLVSLRMWVTDRAIVSGRLRKIFAVDAIRQAATNGNAPQSVGHFLADLTTALTKRIEEVSLGLDERTDQLEEEAYEGKNLQAERIVALRQAVIKMRRFVNPQREAIAALADLQGWIIQPEQQALIRETSNRARRVVEELDATRERLAALQDHVEVHRTQALTRNSYVLSVVAAIFLPLGFLTGLFGVNVGGMPGIDAPSAFWILTGASALIGLVLLLVFKFSRWL